ncbi:hypothetical protein DR63_4007 [Burkholderia thailandensis E264]|nr:hypothetical protein DR63_4007 [Burkholderia thailandensis E264]AJY02019.1 hypothetical protein BG87_4513 [Burkholderia thailandensis 2002721643]
MRFDAPANGTRGARREWAQRVPARLRGAPAAHIADDARRRQSG